MVKEWVKYMTACYLVNELNMALQETCSIYTFFQNFYRAHLIFRLV